VVGGCVVGVVVVVVVVGVVVVVVVVGGWVVVVVVGGLVVVVVVVGDWVIVGASGLTVKLCFASAAAFQLPSPNWKASTVQVPAPTKLTKLDESEQTAELDGSIAKLTGSPEVAVAVRG
jgi:hypothetical protein